MSYPPHLYRRESLQSPLQRGVVKPEEEIVTVPVPPLIDLEIFEAVQKRLQFNKPKVTPPRVVSDPNRCYCGNRGGVMTPRTGKNGRYRYYAGSIRVRQGETGCKGRAIPMDKLDRIMVSHIEERLPDPERIAGLTALRDQARADASRIEAMLASSTHQRLPGAAVRELENEARTRLRLGKGGYRRDHGGNRRSRLYTKVAGRDR